MTLQDKEIFFVLDQLPNKLPTRKFVSLFESSKKWTNLTSMLHFDICKTLFDFLTKLLILFSCRIFGSCRPRINKVFEVIETSSTQAPKGITGGT